MLETGKILQERYRVEKQIGQGGMGSVYLATDKRFNSTVAIKETLFTDEKFRKAFSREARLLNSLKHTALPKVSDTFIDGNGQYIVMEYIAGDDLFEMMEKSEEAFPLKDVMIWAEQLLDALEYLHGQENPVIHRDIKPQNLKLTSEGQIILLDFGLAKGNPTDANHKTAANSIFGYSRNYASLEQIQGTGTDPRSDIYSLAATLYHLLTGKTPSDALTRVMMVLNEEKDPLQTANLIHEQVPEQLASQLDEAMSLNANLRPQTAVEMRELLSGKRKTKVSTVPNTAPNKAVGTNLYTQNTKVFAEGEKPASDSKQSDIKTELLPNAVIAGDSVKTKIAKPITLANNKVNTKNSRIASQGSFAGKKLLGTAAAGILLLVGSVASMVYLWGPESDLNVNGANTDIGTSVKPANLTIGKEENTNTNLNNLDTLATTDENTDYSTPVNDSKTEVATEKPKATDKTETTKTKSSQEKETTKTTVKTKETKPSDHKVIISNGTVKTKDVLIKDGRVETKDVIVNENGLVVKKPAKVKVKLPPNLPISAEEYKKLTPEQQRKVRNALEFQKRMEAKRKRLEKQRRMRNQRRPRPPRPRKP